MVERQYWWVTQGATFEQSLKDQTIRAPQNDKGGRAWFYWDNVAKVKAGDVLFHYADGAVRAVSMATSDGQGVDNSGNTSPDGANGRTMRERAGASAYAANTKREWHATIDAHTLQTPLPIQAFGERLAALNLEKSPVNRSGGASPGFLYELPPDAIEHIVEHMDLSGLPTALSGLLGDWKLGTDEPAQGLEGLLDAWQVALARAGLSFSKPLLRRFAASLLAKRFLILSGLSGSGKTQLSRAFARWITPDDACYAVVAVGADWTSNENVVGYADRLNGGYARTQALSLMLHAHHNPGVPHVLILDEMNLSHVERYLADLLSAMESGEPMGLHAGVTEVEGVPPSLALPDNLFVIGTVNVDETTYLFSPKVLDRANVIEFRADRDEMARHLSQVAHGFEDAGSINHDGARFAGAFVSAAHGTPALSETETTRLRDDVLFIFDVLARHDAEFGFRTASEMMRFVAHDKALGQASDVSNPAWLDAAMDAQLMQKVLPRLNGARNTLAPVIWALSFACRVDRPAIADIVAHAAGEREGDDPASALPDGVAMRYPMTAEKLARMWVALDRNGFASFMEA